MEILTQSFEALWQVVAVGLVLGAGLAALFALGVRALERDRVLLADGDQLTSRASTAGRALAGLCFAVTALAVVFGIVVIVFGKSSSGAEVPLRQPPDRGGRLAPGRLPRRRPPSEHLPLVAGLARRGPPEKVAATV